MKILIFVFAFAIVHSAPPTRKADPSTYQFSYATGESAQSEIGDPDGSVRGAYTYIDETGAVHHVKYIAGHEIGFKVIEDKVDYSSAKPSKNFPLAHEIKLVNGLTPEVAAAKDAHLSVHKSIRNLLPALQQDEEEVKIHHLRHEVPATVHRTFVPESVHSELPPPVKSRNVIEQREVPMHDQIALIDGLTPEVAAEREAHIAYQTALRKLLPQLQEEGEIVVPVHHVHHVHHRGHIKASEPKITKHEVRVITKPDVHIIEHLSPSAPAKFTHVSLRATAAPVETVHAPVHVESPKVEYPLASEIELIDGLTPEVYAERQAHLAQHAAIKSLLPQLEEQF